MKRILIVVALLAVLLIAADVIHLEIGQLFYPDVECSLDFLGTWQGPGGRQFFGYENEGPSCSSAGYQFATDCRLDYYAKIYFLDGRVQWIYECVSRQ